MNRRFRSRVVVTVVLAAGLFLGGGCGKTITFNKPAVNKIKKVAVVIYTVPETIEYKEDPKAAKSGGGIMAVVKIVVKAMSTGNGAKAASASLNEFITTANKQGLPFKVMTQKEMNTNSKFKALIKTGQKRPEKKAAKSMLMGALMPTKPGSSGPVGLNEYGLDANWHDGKALTGSKGEKEYIAEAIKALDVDAALVINDSGYSFGCSACVGAGGVMSGTGSTGSAFNASLVDRNGKVIMNLREWFGSTSASTVVVSNVINPLDFERLYKAHGVKTAKVFSDVFKKQLSQK